MNVELIQEILFAVFAFVGGFGMFLYGMHVMADGLQKSAGQRMKKLLGMLTTNRFLAVTIGALVTAIIQSSSATTVMIVGFVNAGLMNLTQAVGVIMGANIGTTITSWIVSSSEWAAFLKPKEIAPLAIFIGAMFLFFSNRKSHKQVGEILVGFGMIFIGLEFMGGAIKPYRESQLFVDMFLVLGKNPLLGVFAGFAVTAVIQSSSASVGILQTLAASGLVPWNAAVYIILGQNIGTTVTAMLSSIGANKTAKRAAIIHLMFNVVGTVLFTVLMVLYFKFINATLGATIISQTEISVFHTFFNVGNTLLLFPFAKLLVKISERVVPGQDAVVTNDTAVALRHMDDRILETPSFAIENVIKEVIHMGDRAYDNTILATEALIELDDEKIKLVKQNETEINQLEQLITEYLIKINHTPLTEAQQLTLTHMFNTVNDIERVADHAMNIGDLAEYMMKNDVEFSDMAVNELKEMSKYTYETFKISLQTRQDNDLKLVHSVETREEKVDNMEESLRESHIKRLSNRECQPKASVVFLDVISNYERISDHALNIAYYVQDEILV